MIDPYPSPTLGRGAGPKIIAGVAAAVLVVLIVCFIVLYKTGPAPVTATVTPPITSTVVRRPILPSLNTRGSENPDNPSTKELTALKDTDKVFADVTPTMGTTKIEQAVNERLHFTQNDQDYDGLSNAAEVLIYGTNPRYFDTDIDGVTDGNEVKAGTDPLVANGKLSVTDKQAIQDKINYWGTDFAMSSTEQAQSQRDMTRIAYAGQIRVLLSAYYADNNSYPTATTWAQAWEQLKAKNTGLMFTGSTNESWKNGMFDPIDKAPFVFTYTPGDNGQSFTFTYALEVTKRTLTVHDVKGEEGTTTEAPLTITVSAVEVPAGQDSAVALLPPLVNEALAESTTVRTRDGFYVTVSGGAGFWTDLASTHTLEFTVKAFKMAIRAEIREGINSGYCAGNTCYCGNGTTLSWSSVPPVPVTPATPTPTPTPVPTPTPTPTPVPVPAPNAVISPITSACFDRTISLDGSQSQNAVAYLWRVLNPRLQAESSLSGATSATAQFTASQEGTYQASLTASNSVGATSTANTNIYIVNHAPDVQVNVPASIVKDPITVTASATDPDAVTCQDTITSYSWTLSFKGTPVPFTYSNNQQSITFTPQKPGTYDGVVTVTDNHGKSLPKQVQIPIGVPPFNPSGIHETTAP